MVKNWQRAEGETPVTDKPARDVSDGKIVYDIWQVLIPLDTEYFLYFV
jgi:hypothetical protein